MLFVNATFLYGFDLLLQYYVTWMITVEAGVLDYKHVIMV